MKYFIIAFGLIGLGFYYVNFVMFDNTCLVLPIEFATRMLKCISAPLLVGLVGSFIYPGKEFMGISMWLFRLFYTAALIILGILYMSGIPITPEALQKCSNVIGY